MNAFERSKGIDITLKHYNECVISDHGIDGLCGNITNLFNKAIRQSGQEKDFSDELKKNGRALFDQLLTQEVKHAIKNTKATFLLISIDEYLVHIPWELLYDGEEFLCIRFAIGRSVRTKQRGVENRCRDISKPIKMLMVADPNGDLSSAYEEGLAIRTELDKKQSKIKVLSKTGEVYLDFIKKNIRDYDIVHFAGHSVYDYENPSESGWVLKDGRFTAKDIVSLGATAPMPSIVFSNACQSGKTQEWEVKKGLEDEIYGLANAFLLAGVRHYIGTFWKVLDKTCLDFANEFYKDAIDGLPIGEAIRLSRIRLVNKFGYSSIVWASYMLYGDPSINLFFTPVSKRISKEAVFQRQVIILSIILGSILGTGALGFMLYRNYFLKLQPQSQIAWVQKNIVAVMPFDNLTGDKDIDWMGGGIADVIAMKLGRLEKINIIDRAQVENIWKEIKKSEYIDKEGALKIASMVGADRVIMGAFQKAGEEIRVTTRLINVKDGSLFGVTDATNKIDKLFALEDSIALNIIEKLNIKITDIERAELKKLIPTNNINAFEFNAKATNAFIARDIQGAIQFCKKALEIDPNYIGANLSAAFLYEWAGDIEMSKHYYQRVIELSEAKKDKSSLMAANFNLGRIAFGEWKIKEALDYQNKALNISRYLKDQQSYAQIVYNMGLCYMRNNEFDKAKRMLLESKEISERLSNKFLLADSYLGLGIYYSMGKDIDSAKAKDNFEKGFNIYEALNSREGLTKALFMLGTYYAVSGDYDEAIAYLMKSLKISIDIDNKLYQTLAYNGLGSSYAGKEEFGNAQECYEKSLALNESMGNSVGIKNDLYSLSSLFLRQLRYDEALKYLEAFVGKAEKDNDHRNEALGLQIIGRIYLDTGRFEEAIQKYNVALSYKDDLGLSQNVLRETYFGLGLSNDKLGRVQERDKYFSLALEVAKNKEGMVSLGYVYSNLGKFNEDKGEIEKAIGYYKQASEILEKAQTDPLAKMFLESPYYGLAECYKKQNNKLEAIKYYKLALTIAEEVKSPRIPTIKSNLYNIDKEARRDKDTIINNEALALYDKANALHFNGENEKALSIAREAYQREPHNEKIIGLVCLIYDDLGQFQEAINIHLEYIKILSKKEDIRKIISHYAWIGDEYRHTVKLDEAKEYYEKALSLAKESGDKEALGSVYADYSMVWEALNQDDKAIEFATRGIELCKDTSEVFPLVNAYQVLSNIYSKQNNKEKALEYAQLSLKVDEESGNVAHLGTSYVLVGSLYRNSDIVKSLEYLNKAVGFFEKQNDVQSLGNVYHEIGLVYEKNQQIDKALEYLNKSLEISEKVNDKWTTLANYLGLESAYYITKDYKLSEDFRNKYINLSKELKQEEALGQIYGAVGNRFIDDDQKESEKFLLQSNGILEKYRSEASLKTLFMNYNSLAHLSYKKNNLDDTIIYFDKAINLAEKEQIEDKISLGDAYNLIGFCYQKKGDPNKALGAYRKARAIFVQTAREDQKKLIVNLDNEIKRIEFYLSIKERVQYYDDFVNKAVTYHKEKKWELALENYKNALKLAKEIKEIKDSAKDELMIKDMTEREKWLNNEIIRLESYLKEVETSKKTKPAEYLNANAILYVRQNRLEAALENFKKSLEIYQGLDDKKNIALSKLRIGLVYLTKNDIKNAKSLFAEAMALYKTINDSESIGLMHGASGILSEKVGKYDKAIEEYNSAMDLLKESQYIKTYIAAYNNCLGSVYYKKKDYTKSLESYKKALEANKDTEDPNSISLTETMIAYINLTNNMLQEASYSVDNALAIAEKIDDKDLVSICYLIKGKIFLKQNNFVKANDSLNKAVTYADMIANEKLKVISCSNLAILAKEQNNKVEYEKWLGMIKSKDDFGCIVAGDISSNKEESLFKEVIEEKDFFKRIWL